MAMFPKSYNKKTSVIRPFVTALVSSSMADSFTSGSCMNSMGKLWLAATAFPSVTTVEVGAVLAVDDPADRLDPVLYGHSAFQWPRLPQARQFEDMILSCRLRLG